MTAHAIAERPMGRLSEQSKDAADSALVAQAKQGDAAAFTELVRRHQHVVYNLAYRYMRQHAAAEDMTQEAFLKGFRMLKGFRGDCSFSSWMYRVTSSVCLTELNRRKRRNEVAYEPGHARAAADEPKTDQDVPEVIRGCVGQLPERYATIITMYYLREISYEEIAEAMDIPLGTLKTWMHRARKQLRAIVEKEILKDHPNALS